MDVNVNGVLYTAQAAGRQMSKFGTPGSIILIASMSGSITNKVSVYDIYGLWKNVEHCELGSCMGRLQHK